MQKIGFCDKFSLTQAVLNGTKTMTRRVEKGLETFEFDYEVNFVHSMEIINQYWDEEKNSLAIITPQGKMKVPTRYKLGEVVAVAQSYEDIYHHGGPEYGSYELVNNYRRLHIRPWKDITQQAGWSNKMFVRPDLMPHQIEITGVRIERLQAISDDDCLKEGVICETFDDGTPLCYKVLGIYDKPKSLLLKEFMTPREAFALLINRPGVGRKGLWESNPFVVVYEFKLEK